MLRDDRKRAGWLVEQVVKLLELTVREYRRLEAGERWPSWETYERIRRMFYS